MAVICRLDPTVGGAVPELGSLVAVEMTESWSSRGQRQHLKISNKGNKVRMAGEGLDSQELPDGQENL